MPIRDGKLQNWLSKSYVSKLPPPGAFDGDSASYYNSKQLAEYKVAQSGNISVGDHICLKRKTAGGTFIYTHHGIYLGDGLIANYSGDAKSALDRKVTGWVQLTELSSFLAGSTHFTLVRHSQRDKCVVVARVLLNLGRRNYDPGQENCEHFATFCTTGTPQSIQVLAGGIAFDIIFNAVCAPIIRSFYSFRDFIELEKCEEKCKKGKLGSSFQNNPIYLAVDDWMTNGGIRTNLTTIKKNFDLDDADIDITI
jgi:hypothetical protein